MIPEALVSSKSQDWATPWPVFEAMRAIYPYDIDLAASSTSKKCEKYLGLDKGDDALHTDWHLLGKYGWCNPPYGDKRYPVRRWAWKAVYESRHKDFTSTLLLPLNKQDQKWFHQWAIYEAEIFIVEGRINFVDPVTGQRPKKWVEGKNGKPGKWVTDGNSQGSMLITWGPNVEPKFRSIRFKI